MSRSAFSLSVLGLLVAAASGSAVGARSQPAPGVHPAAAAQARAVDEDIRATCSGLTGADRHHCIYDLMAARKRSSGTSALN